MSGDTNAMAEAVFEAVKAYCDTSADRVLSRAAELLDARIAALPVAKDGKDGGKGETGEKGDKGDPGVPGERGKDGATGKDGEPGMVGLQGPPGRDGRDGTNGKDGAPGKDGAKGLDGKPGDRGAPGKDGEPGAKGERGEQGLIGLQGPPGRDGRDGLKGKDGAPGEPGADGAHGRDGKDGRDGKPGEPGRDALQIDVLPTIDTTRSYPRSTYAQWGGGIIRSTRTTDPIPDGGLLSDAGWSFVVRGISAIDIRQVGERNFEFSALFNDGTVERKAFTVPAQIYRGVYLDGKTYDRGDTVTWAGSQWHCDQQTTERPGEGGAWRLSVKRGRDGKDASPEPRSPAIVKI